MKRWLLLATWDATVFVILRLSDIDQPEALRPRGRRAEPSRTDDEHAGFRQLGLPADADTRQDGLSRIAPESASVGVHLRASEPVRQGRARARRIKYSTPIRTPTTARSAPSHGVSTQNHRKPSPVIVNPQARRTASMANTRRGERRVGLVVMTSTPSIFIEKTESLRLMTPREFR